MTYRWIAGVCLALVVVSGCSSAASRKAKAYAEGNAALEKKQYPEAILAYRNAIKIDPRYGEARYKLAEAYTASGDPQNAARQYVNAAELLPENLDSIEGIARFVMSKKS